MFFFFQAEDGIRDLTVTGVQTCALPISRSGDALSDAADRRAEAAPRPHGDRRREGPARRGARRGARRRAGGVADREPRDTRGSGLPAGSRRSARAVTTQPAAPAAATRPRRGAPLPGPPPPPPPGAAPQ